MTELPARIDAVLLDLDGTLSASGPAITAALRRAFAELGVPTPTDTALQAFVGPPLQESFAALPGFDDDRVHTAVTTYRRHYDPLAAPLFDGVVDALTALRTAGVPLVLATSKPQPLAEQVVAGTPLRGLLDAVVGSDRERGRRTKGDVVAAALAVLGRTSAPAPGSPVMVGDRVHDVAGAAEHGVPCIGALWGYGSRQELSGAAALVGTPAELVAVLLAR